MKNEAQIIELLVEYLKRLDRLEARREEDRKEFQSKMLEFNNRMEAQSNEFRESFYFNQKNIAAAQEDIRNQNKIMLAMLEEQGYHAERLDKLEKGK